MNTDRTIIAIDPGCSGGIAVWATGCFPVVYKFHDEYVMARLLDRLAVEPDCIPVAYLERVHSMPGQGVASSFKFGANYGFYRGCIQALGVSLIEVTPQAWQKGLMLPAGKGNQAARKKQLLQLARERHPEVTGINLATCDALMILDWAINKETKEDK